MATMNLAPLRSSRQVGRMLEYWNVGIMGFGDMGHWFIGKITLDIEASILVVKTSP